MSNDDVGCRKIESSGCRFRNSEFIICWDLELFQRQAKMLKSSSKCLFIIFDIYNSAWALLASTWPVDFDNTCSTFVWGVVSWYKYRGFAEDWFLSDFKTLVDGNSAHNLGPQVVFWQFRARIWQIAFCKTFCSLCCAMKESMSLAVRSPS